MSSINDYWKSPAWLYQDKDDALYDLMAGDVTIEQTISIDDAVTNGVTDAQTLAHTTSGTPAAGIGVGLVFDLENSTPAVHEAGRIDVTFATVTAASEDSNMAFKVYDGGSLVTPLQITGATPVVAVTGQLSVSAAAAMSGIVTIAVDDATNNDVTNVLVLTHTTSGTPTADLGAGIQFNLENSTPATHEAAQITAEFAVVTADSEDSVIKFYAYDGGTKYAALGIRGSDKTLVIADPGTGSSVDPASHTGVDDWLEIQLGDPDGSPTEMFIPLYAAT